MTVSGTETRKMYLLVVHHKMRVSDMYWIMMLHIHHVSNQGPDQILCS